MAQQTINVGASPNDGTGTPLRTAFQYTNSNFSELYTAVGPSGNNIVVPGSATITGDLTVDTNTLKVDSANNRVGIGTASPAYLLDIADASFATRFVATNTNNSAFGAGVYLKTLNGASMVSNATLATSNDGTFNLLTGTSADSTKLSIGPTGIFTFQNVGGVAGTAMTLNSTGLGVGGSPVSSYKLLSAKTSGGAQLALTTGAANGSNASPLNIDLDFLGYLNETRARIRSTDQTSDTGNGFLSFWTQNSGSFTEKMRLSSEGNVGVGVTPSAWDTNYKALQLGYPNFISGNNGGNIIDIGVNAYFNTDWKYAASSVAATRYRQVVGFHQWFTAPSGTAGNAITWTQAMTLAASGNLLIGTTTDVSTVRMQVWSSSADNTAQFRNSNASTPYGPSVKYTAATPNNTGSEFLYCEDSTALRASIRSNGGIANYQANDVSLSDSRLKTDIKPLASYWNKIKSLELVTFKYKDQTHSDDNIGLIAQQVESVAPELVDVDGFGETPADGVPIKTIYTTDLYHAAIKALQEAMARIEALEAKLA